MLDHANRASFERSRLPYVYLAIAIVTEVAATAALRASNGFTRPLPSLVVVVGYVICFIALALCVRRIPIGVAYGIWSGVGLVLITIAAWWLYGQRVDAPAIVGMGLILAGVIVIQLFSNTKSVEPPQERGTPPAGAAAIEDP
ncbi:MAG: QacE family quaternary ammonium compound efflux SMR transporter [Planctomycetaceae bacterium]|nr:QacE family quaternary ammonium compound efflux SMR transporter [Planctomycetaceae bacterium]